MSTNTATSQTPDQKIDALLERYLVLLDQYTTLRTSLNALQKNLFQSLARANFSAERGVAYYGKDYYDERMQASRKLSLVSPSIKPPLNDEREVYASLVFECEVAIPPTSEDAPKEDDSASNGEKTSEGENKVGEAVKKPGNSESRDVEGKNGQDGEKKATQTKKKKGPNTDPLRWFGIMTPLALRQAQAQAIKAIEEVIPRLASVSVEMAEVELEVRRARKKRAKAEKEEKATAQGREGEGEGL